MPQVLLALAKRVLDGSGERDKASALVEAELAAERAVLVDSGRSALSLAIALSLHEPAARRIVAIPAFQCFEVATAAVGVDCRIALYDIDPATLRPDVESLERALRLGASAVVIAPLYGLPVDWDALAALAGEYGAVAIEDAAQANGAEWKGRRAGSLGAVSVVSFGRGKGWTGGGGGALLLRGAAAVATDDALDRLAGPGSARELRMVAVAALQVLFGRPGLYGIPASVPSLGLGETQYHAPTAAGACPAFSAALMRRTLEAARAEAVVRRRNAAFWRDALPSKLAHGVPPVLASGTPGYLRFPLRITPGAAHLAVAGRWAGIARSYPQTLAALPAVAERLVEPGATFAGAESLVEQLVTLPTHSRLEDADRETIIAALAT